MDNTSTAINISNAVTKDYAHYAKKVKKLKGINVLNIDIKEGASKLNITANCEPFDFTLNGCKMIVDCLSS